MILKLLRALWFSINVFFTVKGNTSWLYFVSGFLVRSLLITVLLVSFPCRWRNVCKILQPMGSKGWCLKKCPNICWPIKSQGKYSLKRTCRSNLVFAITGKKYVLYISMKSLRSPLKILQLLLLYMPRSIHSCQQGLKSIWWPGPFNFVCSIHYFKCKDKNCIYWENRNQRWWKNRWLCV